MNKRWIAGVISTAVVLGCANTNVKESGGNESLGIAEFRTTETANQVTVVALDKAGATVGTLSLYHGRYVSSETGLQVDGRKFKLELGTSWVGYESDDYVPRLSMPGSTKTDAPIFALLADPHITVALAQWGIGYATQPPGEVAYGSFVDSAGTTAQTVNSCTAGSNATLSCPNPTANGPYDDHTYAGKTGIICPNNGLANGMSAYVWATGDVRIAQCCNPPSGGTGVWAFQDCNNNPPATGNSCGSGICSPCLTGSWTVGCNVFLDWYAYPTYHLEIDLNCAANSCQYNACGDTDPVCGGICSPGYSGCSMPECGNWDGTEIQYNDYGPCPTTDRCGNSVVGYYEPGDPSCTCDAHEPDCCSDSECGCGEMCSSGTCVSAGCDGLSQCGNNTCDDGSNVACYYDCSCGCACDECS